MGISTGEKPILLLIPNRRSLGGGGLLTACIVKLVNIGTGKVLYQHPHYYPGYVFTAEDGSAEAGYSATVWRQEMLGIDKPAHGPRGVYANCKAYTSAHRLAAFMNGVRHAK